ncbi:MAG: LppP/LprE family lipoprotein, partial [Chloroflexi bacterium]|nr:LppP/LprE family lipoprotein [Chloroflexota bacterium]
MKTDLLRQGIRQSAWRGGVGAAMLLAASAAGAVHADGKWLDSAPQRWNNPGGWVPSAPKGDNLDRCGTQERQPAADEESQLAAANWRLQNFWPMQTNGKVSIVTATASYDGMCRPWQFNAFVFYDHKFAGTISPSNMDSRLDSVLRSTPTAMPDGSVRAEFTRYAASDPLCCPSLGTTTVSYRIEGAP